MKHKYDIGDIVHLKGEIVGVFKDRGPEYRGIGGKAITHDEYITYNIIVNDPRVMPDAEVGRYSSMRILVSEEGVLAGEKED